MPACGRNQCSNSSTENTGARSNFSKYYNTNIEDIENIENEYYDDRMCREVPL